MMNLCKSFAPATAALSAFLAVTPAVADNLPENPRAEITRSSYVKPSFSPQFYTDAEVEAKRWTELEGNEDKIAFVILVGKERNLPDPRLEERYYADMEGFIVQDKIRFFYQLTQYSNPFGFVYAQGSSDGHKALSEMTDHAKDRLKQIRFVESLLTGPNVSR